MAQNEGRTLRRAPSRTLRNLTLFVVMLFVALTFGLLVHSLKVAATAALVTETAHKSVPTSNEGTGTSTLAETTGGNPSSQGNENSVPNCTPAAYRLPTPLNVAGLPTGVTTIEDSPQQYTIYGNDADERLQQLQRCAPAGEYAGAASYQVTWQYSYAVRTDGLCQVVQPKIGLHLTMILPHWQTGSQTAAQERAAWNTYISALTVHERGHYAISKRYADAMLSGLQKLSAQSCSTIKAAANSLLTNKLAGLKTAQENYDAVTDHGATQGAVL